MADDNGRPTTATALLEPQEEPTAPNKAKGGRAEKAAKKKAGTGRARGANARVAYPKNSLIACLRNPSLSANMRPIGAATSRPNCVPKIEQSKR